MARGAWIQDGLSTFLLNSLCAKGAGKFNKKQKIEQTTASLVKIFTKQNFPKRACMLVLNKHFVDSFTK